MGRKIPSTPATALINLFVDLLCIAALAYSSAFYREGLKEARQSIAAAYFTCLLIDTHIFFHTRTQHICQRTYIY